MYKSALIKKTKKAKLILGHDRKASIGEISLETAQPVCLYDDNNEIEFVLIHNGTIYNYTELAEKYIPHVDIKGLTDSQVMARIFYWAGYEALDEYNGAAVFVILDYRGKPKDSPTVYMYKGASKLSEHSKDIVVERPLYLTISKNEIWFSSIADMLDAISFPDTCMTLSHNILTEVSYDTEIDLYTTKKVDRSKCIQNKKYTQYKSYNNNTHNRKDYGYGNYNNYDSYGSYDTYDDYYKNNKGVYTKRESTYNFKNDWITEDDLSGTNRVVLCADGLYRRGKELVHGIYSLSRFGYGYITTSNQYESGSYCFFKGRLLPSIEVYNMLMSIAEFAEASPSDFEDEFPQVVDMYSYIPSINILADGKNIEAYEVDRLDNIIPFSGFIKPIFSSNFKQFEFIDSLHIDTETSTTMNENIEAYIEFTKEWEKVTLDIEEYTIKEFILKTRKEAAAKQKVTN